MYAWVIYGPSTVDLCQSHQPASAFVIGSDSCFNSLSLPRQRTAIVPFTGLIGSHVGDRNKKIGEFKRILRHGSRSHHKQILLSVDLVRRIFVRTFQKIGAKNEVPELDARSLPHHAARRGRTSKEVRDDDVPTFMI